MKTLIILLSFLSLPLASHEMYSLNEYELTLYSSPNCPYCRKVLNYMKKHKITLPIKNPKADKDAYRELVDIGGKAQIPCLMIDGRALYESSDIVRWLQKHK